jgi:hypothetical protein
MDAETLGRLDMVIGQLRQARAFVLSGEDVQWIYELIGHLFLSKRPSLI